jgi:hypothetical protein
MRADVVRQGDTPDAAGARHPHIGRQRGAREQGEDRAASLKEHDFLALVRGGRASASTRVEEEPTI